MVLLPKPLTFGVGETSKSFDVLVTGDTIDEGDEKFTVTLQNAPDGATISLATAIATIEDDDEPAATAKLSIVAGNSDRLEGDNGVVDYTFQVTRSDALDGVTAVDYAVASTSQADGADFVGGLPSGSLTFNPGESTKTIFIPVNGDEDIELDETFEVVLSNSTGEATIVTGQATGVIQNDDVAALGLQLPNQVDEGSGTFSATVFRNTPTDQPLLVSIASLTPTIFTVPESVTIPIGASSVDFDINVVDNDRFDGGQQGQILVSASGLRDATGLVSVVDDEVPTLIISLADDQVPKFDGITQLTIARTGPLLESVSVILLADQQDPFVLNRTVQAPRNITIPAGSSSLTVDVEVIDDEYAERNSDFLFVAMAPGYSDGMSGLTVIDDDIAAIAFDHTDGSTFLSETGIADFVGIRIPTRPYTNVVIDIAVAPGSGFEVEPTQLTFTPDRWQESQFVRVKTTDQFSPENLIDSFFSLSAGNSGDLAYQLVASVEVPLVVAGSAGDTLAIRNSETGIELYDEETGTVLSRPTTDTNEIVTGDGDETFEIASVGPEGITTLAEPGRWR